jgi:hypothetical protein
MAGVRAFREAFMSSDVSDPDDWAAYESRQTRYAILWAFYENTAYRNVHLWSPQMRTDYGMYKYSRNIYNPAYRLGSFWQTYLWGGGIDREAGDGKTAPSALPIVTDDKTLRAAIARTWLNSNWMVKKNIVTLWGSTLGDVGLRVVDDPVRKKVYLAPVHPSTIADLEMDSFGNVKGYTLMEYRFDDDSQTDVLYTEVAGRDGDSVVYETYKGDTLYGWNEMPATWSESYGFVPFVMIKHNDVGLDWGWSELFPALSKVREVDDLASKISDQVRKMVDAPFLFSGVENPKKTVRTTTSTDSGKTEPGREEIPALYGPAGASATPLVAQLDIAAATAHVTSILSEIERDFPELQHDIWSTGGDASGRALRVARQRVESKVMERRANYDNALVRAQQMAVAIGGFRGYDGFSGFGLDSYGEGKLDHRIGDRPVFAGDPLDKVELDTAFWSAADLAVKAGVPIEVYLEREGWDAATIAKILGSVAYQQKITAGTFG